MKKTGLFVWILAALAWPVRGASPAPMFSPAPPEPGAAEFVEAYLPLLASGAFDQALALNDLRGMRQYLLERRLAELKTKNPEMTAQDIEEISAHFQTNELHPARLQDILREVMKENRYEGMTWRILGYAPAPQTTGGYLVSIEARTTAGQEKPILLGIKKLGEQWWVAPETIEELMGRKPVIQAVPRQAPPEPVAALIDRFWKHWQAGELNEAYALFSPAYRTRTSLLAFLQQAQDFIAQNGVPASWTLVQGLETGPRSLWMGVNVQGSTATKPTLMQFVKAGETWTLEELQLQPPPRSSPSAPAPGASRFQSDLKPDLRPGAVLPASTPPAEPEPAAAPPAPAPAQPDGPTGPDDQ